ncbi:MAG: hypothetical protein KF864_07830 [Phycisphaeraceae bacterium]|nr:hypothetical protein [Phycisphaeraceae bacterium]
MTPANARAVALAGALAELGVTSLLMERGGTTTILAARATDLPGTLALGGCVLRTDSPALVVTWQPHGACPVAAADPAARALLEAALAQGNG